MILYTESEPSSTVPGKEQDVHNSIINVTEDRSKEHYKVYSRDNTAHLLKDTSLYDWI